MLANNELMVRSVGGLGVVRGDGGGWYLFLASFSGTGDE